MFWAEFTERDVWFWDGPFETLAEILPRILFKSLLICLEMPMFFKFFLSLRSTYWFSSLKSIAWPPSRTWLLLCSLPSSGSIVIFYVSLAPPRILETSEKTWWPPRPISPAVSPGNASAVSSILAASSLAFYLEYLPSAFFSFKATILVSAFEPASPASKPSPIVSRAMPSRMASAFPRTSPNPSPPSLTLSSLDWFWMILSLTILVRSLWDSNSD